MTEKTITPLPDDPRECCRAAIRILNDDDFEDAETLVRDVLAVVFAASDDVVDPDRMASSVSS